MTKGTTPIGIGPHEDRELELMLAGTKPLAMFTDVLPPSFEFPESVFAPYVASGEIIRREEVYRNPRSEFATRIVYFALAGEEWRIDALHAINEAIFSGLRAAREQDDIETGRLLGYSDEEIAGYLEWTKTANRGSD